MGGIARQEQAPVCIGSTTKERMGVIPFWRTGPSVRRQSDSSLSRACNSDQIRSSRQPSMLSSGRTWR